MSDEIRRVIRQFAISNALAHDGKARVESVAGILLAERADLRPRAKELLRIVSEVVEEVNALPKSELSAEGEVVTLRKDRASETRKKELPPLPNAGKYKVIVTRFAPNPDGPLTFGHARAIILSHEYSIRYAGKFIIRFEDTDPKTKPPTIEAYDWIREDLEWLGADWQEEYIQSARLEIYYRYAERLLNDSVAYVCTCKPTRFRSLVRESRACPCRSKDRKLHLSRWKKMLSGEYPEGKAVVRIKTDLQHPNPAVRDWPALRIIDTSIHPHPLVGSKFRVWPLYNFSASIDDHEMGITHILRAKEHVTNVPKQEYVYRHMGWEYPEAIHYGMVLLPEAKIHKSVIRQEISEGKYLGWDDPRLTTLRAMRRRGIVPETIRRFMLEIGAKPVEATLSWDNLYSINRKLLDPTTKRYSFVADPIDLEINGLQNEFEGKIPYHPQKPEYGFHYTRIVPSDGRARIQISKDDFANLEKGTIVRLMGLFNIQVDSKEPDGLHARYHSTETESARKSGAQIIQWVQPVRSVPIEVVMPDANRRNGVGETDCLNIERDSIVQFLRFGFVRIDQNDGKLVAFYAHK